MLFLTNLKSTFIIPFNLLEIKLTLSELLLVTEGHLISVLVFEFFKKFGSFGYPDVRIYTSLFRVLPGEFLLHFFVHPIFPVLLNPLNRTDENIDFLLVFLRCFMPKSDFLILNRIKVLFILIDLINIMKLAHLQ